MCGCDNVPASARCLVVDERIPGSQPIDTVGFSSFEINEELASSVFMLIATLFSSQEYHAVLRRLLAHGFSEKALRSQEEILQEYSDIMVDKIGKGGNGKEAVVDIVSWYNVSYTGNRLIRR
jgi:cytochrome P450